ALESPRLDARSAVGYRSGEDRGVSGDGRLRVVRRGPRVSAVARPVIVMQGESLNWFVRQRPLLFYPQQWYISEPFAGRAVTGSFELNGVPLPAAVYAAAFVLAFDRDGTVLWPDYYQWTS